MNPIQIVIGARDKASHVLEKVGEHVESLAQKVQGFHKQFTEMGAVLEIGGGLLTVGTGLEELPAVALEQEHMLKRVSVQTRIFGKDMEDLHEEIISASKSSNQYVDDTKLTALELIKAQVPIKETTELLPVLGRMATASSQSMQILGKAAIGMRDQLKISPEEMPKALDELTSVSKDGKVTLEDMTNNMSGLLVSAKLLGLHGPNSLAQMGASLQVIARGSNNSQEAIESFQHYVDRLHSGQMLSKLFSFSPLLMQRYVNIFRTAKDPILELSRFLQNITKNDAARQAVLFGRDVNSLKAMKQLTEGWRDREEIINRTQHAEGENQRDFNLMMETTTERWKQFKIQLQTTALPMLEPQLKRVSGILEYMDTHAFAVKATLFSIGGFLVGGASLLALGQFAKSLTSIIELSRIVIAIAPALGVAFTGIALPLMALASYAVILTALFVAIKTLKDLNDSVNMDEKLQRDLRGALAKKGWSQQRIDEALEKRNKNVQNELGNDRYGHAKEASDEFLAMSGGFGQSPWGKNSVDVHVKVEGPAGTRVSTSKEGKDVNLHTEHGMSFAN